MDYLGSKSIEINHNGSKFIEMFQLGSECKIKKGFKNIKGIVFKKIISDTGNRTRACWVRASYPNSYTMMENSRAEANFK